MRETDIGFESLYAVPISDNANQWTSRSDDLQANFPTDFDARFMDDGRGAFPGAPPLPHIPSAPARNVYAHESAPYAMNAMALEVEATILAQDNAWQWIPDQAIGRRGFKGIIVEQAPEIDPYTQAIMPEPREGYRGVFPYDRFTQIPFPNSWE